MCAEPLNEKPSGAESARIVPAGEKALIADGILREKVRLMDKRLKTLHSFEGLAPDRFAESLPALGRAMALLAQSAIDISHTLLRRYTTRVPRSYYDIVDSCEQRGLLSAALVKPLARQLVLADSGYEGIDAEDVARIHKGIPESVRVFQDFLDRAREFLNHSS